MEHAYTSVLKEALDGARLYTSVLKEGMDQVWLAVTSGSSAKGSAMGLEVAGSGPIQLPFSLPPSFLPCVVYNNFLSFAQPWYLDFLVGCDCVHQWS